MFWLLTSQSMSVIGLMIRVMQPVEKGTILLPRKWLLLKLTNNYRIPKWLKKANENVSNFISKLNNIFWILNKTDIVNDAILGVVTTV